MPEGDSLHRLAAKLAPILENSTITSLAARRLSEDVLRSLVGRRITSVSAKGKNLLVRFDDERVLHVHLRMSGRVYVERKRSSFWLPDRALPDLRLEVTGGHVIVGRHLAVLRVMTSAQVHRTADLANLGPDLVREGWDEESAVARLRALSDRSIGEALLVQRAIAGIGNVYKSEVLFLERIDPFSPVSALSDEVLTALLRRASILLRSNLGDGPRTTRRTLGGARLWVYNRGGRACLRCASTIVRVMQGPSPGRSTYLCPRCQPRSPDVRAEKGHRTR